MKNINHNPKFSLAIIANNILNNSPMTIIDVGAAGGYAGIWRIFDQQLKVIGFEPSLESFKNLPQENDNCKYFNVALGKNRDPVNLFITRWPYSCGTFKPNHSFLKRFPNGKCLEVISEKKINPISLDEFCEISKTDDFDYIKLDTEGSELDILIGASSSLKNCLAVEVEVAFYKYHENRPLFSDVENYLRGLGFFLYDLDVYRHARSALPSLTQPYVNPSDHGQVLWGDAIFIKDLVDEFKKNSVKNYSNEKIIKAICIFEIFNQHDSAIELLEYSIRNGVLPLSMEPGLDFLIPPTLGRNLSLRQYRKLFSNIPQPL